MAEALDRRQQIIDSAAASFASRGVAATTVRQIADEVGILSGSLYHHFESKEAIVEAIISPYLDELRVRYREALSGAGDPPTRLRNLVAASLATAATHPQATEIYQNDVNYLRGFERFAFLRDVQREVRAAWLAVINEGVATGAFRSDVDPQVFYRLIRDAVWLSVRWFYPSDDYPVSRLADQCTAVFLDGLAARPAAPAAPSSRRRRSAARTSAS
ncbi:TetR/AcrR family transcriptional regulator [Phytohabitans kaempferiae]|uniref:TetR/AcrR family transcriptional regulator n=1 Tax=Phytohabitans kaempferiae TaxID=1620943 RepID=A0ABV6LZM4_9ACTN